MYWYCSHEPMLDVHAASNPVRICLCTQVEDWLVNIAADVAFTFVVLSPSCTIFFFCVSWVSVKWFSGMGIIELLKCIPCRKKNHKSVVPACTVAKHQSVITPHEKKSVPQKTEPTNSTESMLRANALDTKVET